MKDKNKIEVSYLKSDEYKSLMDDCRSAFVEMVYGWKMDFILMHGRIGQRVYTDKLYKKFKKGTGGFLRQLAKDIKMSHQELYESIEFYKRFGIVNEKSAGWDKFKEGKNLSWNKIVNLYLREPKPEHICSKFEKVERCEECHRIKANVEA